MIIRCLAILTILGALLTPTAASATSRLDWTSCGSDFAGFECARLAVPMDYRQPRGRRISIAMIRLPAADPAHRIGSLFTNFGGPGADGYESLRQYAHTATFPAAVRARFDLVSFDPRGIGRSTPVNCFASQAEQRAYFDQVPYFPDLSTAAEQRFYAQAAELSRRCGEHAGPLLAHMSTVNVARDLDRMRQAVGEDKLTFQGFSYGTVVGATYANLFPRNVRAMIIDGTLDMVGNAVGHGDEGRTLSIGTRQGVADAGQEVLSMFFRLCAQAGPKCAFSKGGDLPAKWLRLLDSVKRKPIGTYDYPAVSGDVYNLLSEPMTDWPKLGTLLQSLYDGKPPAASMSYVDNGSEAYPTVQCEDADAPRKLSTYTALGKTEDVRIPAFGRMQVFDPMPCPTWPVADRDRFVGPWNRSLTPILVVNSTHDPSTPLSGAVKAVRQLRNARLLAVDAPGHTALLRPRSACADAYELTYLTSGRLPAAGTTCPVDELPWGLR
ncbi:alpha/beta hydrolase [Fodinicola acaciae]|uniref:alpha/beta hydrolase n=1 Tax=Fodinicola acaciae TaxID=2681555 RepID=UPI0013D5581E|nr:alpha/beta hydrolase [Fodinicola acaciae]